MGRVRSTGNTSTEEKLIKVLKENHLNGWRRGYPIFGRPDIAFSGSKVAVFVDGCFWHGCPKHSQIPGNNREFWVRKLDANKKRDRLVNKTIKSKGWKVIRIWECQLKDKQTLKRKINRLDVLLKKHEEKYETTHSRRDQSQSKNQDTDGVI